MKILIVVDKLDSAIDRLAKAVKRHVKHHEVQIFPVHPKRNDVNTIVEAQRLMAWADLIDIHYWRSGEVLRTSFPKEFEEKPRVLFHMNPYDADKEEVNKRYDAVVVGNTIINNKVPYAHLIPYGIDLDFFKFKKEYTEEKIVNMVVARIEGKKGIKEVAQVCKKLGYTLRLVGRVSKPDYMREVMEAGGKAVEFWENATDEKLREIYYQSAIHVCNSVDSFESGTLPILEAMACGVPVLTRSVGHVLDIYNGKNMVVRSGKQENLEDLEKTLKEMMENREWCLKMRQKAWDTVRNRDERIMVHRILKLYNQLYKPSKSLVSIIIPTRDNPKGLVGALYGALTQDYDKCEVIVCDSGDVSVKPIIEKAKKKTELPIKYIHFPHKGNYTLAEARNRGVIEAEGDVLVFCDDRLQMDKRAVSAFMSAIDERVWLWGEKDGAVKGFVENFSCVKRKELINGGMFNERIQWYGGMTQEIRTRFEKGRGFQFLYIQEAKAKSIMRAGSKARRRDDIREAKWTLFKMYS